MVHVVLSYPPWSPTACFTFQQCYRFSRTLVNVMGECFANGILQWCGKVWNWGNQNESKQPILYSDIWEQFLITQNCTNIMIFLRVSHMRGKQHCIWALTLLWLCRCSLVPRPERGRKPPFAHVLNTGGIPLALWTINLCLYTLFLSPNSYSWTTSGNLGPLPILDISFCKQYMSTAWFWESNGLI